MSLGGAWSVKKIKPALFAKAASRNLTIQVIESLFFVMSPDAATAEIQKLGIKSISAPITKDMNFHLKTSLTKFRQRLKIKHIRYFLIFVPN
jgi:hypothetical protein